MHIYARVEEFYKIGHFMLARYNGSGLEIEALQKSLNLDSTSTQISTARESLSNKPHSGSLLCHFFKGWQG